CQASLGVPVGPPARPKGLLHGCGKPNPYAGRGLLHGCGKPNPYAGRGLLHGCGKPNPYAGREITPQVKLDKALWGSACSPAA
ncbi:MAG: hypothetical protein M3Y81_26550, partial [Chloroflexota bacterium]|nr:hypothetical protein [Chloroflexota bacterium]